MAPATVQGQGIYRPQIYPDTLVLWCSVYFAVVEGIPTQSLFSEDRTHHKRLEDRNLRRYRSDLWVLTELIVHRSLKQLSRIGH